ncbi:MAG: hypothetical protein V4609_13375, partial [Pseudomonadota bacterium]
TTFKRPDGRDLVIEPSYTFRNVRIWIKGSDEIITIPLELAGAAAFAIEQAGEAIEARDNPPELPSHAIQCGACVSPRPDCMGAVIPGIGNRCGAMAESNTSSPSEDVSAKGEGASASSPASLAFPRYGH